MGNVIRLSLGWTLLLFFLLLLLFWTNAGVVGSVPATGFFMDMPVGVLLERFAAGNPVTGAVLDSLLMLINSGLLIRIVSRNMILADRSYLSIVVYVAIGAGCTTLGYSSLPVFVLSFLMISSFGLMLSSFRRVVRYGDLFNSTLLAGIALLIWSHAVVYLLLLPVSLIIFKKDGRECIVALTGYVLPMAICSYVYWGMGHPISYVFYQLCEGIVAMFNAEFVPQRWLHPALLLFWGIALTVCVLSVISSMKRAPTLRTRTYKAFVYFLWILICSLLPFCLPGRSLLDCVLISVPMAILIPSYLVRLHGWIPQTVYLLMLVAIVVYNLFPDLTIG